MSNEEAGGASRGTCVSECAVLGQLWVTSRDPSWPGYFFYSPSPMIRQWQGSHPLAAIHQAGGSGRVPWQ